MLAIPTAFSPETKQHRSSIEHSTLVQKKRKAGISASASAWSFALYFFRFYSAAWISTHLIDIPLLVSFFYLFFVVFLFVNTASVDFNCFHCFDSPGNTASWSQPQPLARPFSYSQQPPLDPERAFMECISNDRDLQYKRAFFFLSFPYLQHYIFSFLPVLKVKRNIAAMQPPARHRTRQNHFHSRFPIFLQTDHLDP
jgi:hypothetical protein